MPLSKVNFSRCASVIAMLALWPLAGMAEPGRVFGAEVTAVTGGGQSVTVGGTNMRESFVDRGKLPGNYASALAQLSDGSLHAHAGSVEQSHDCWLGVPRSCVISSAAASAMLFDTVTFHAADLKNPAEVRWKFEIDGTEYLGPWKGYRSGATAKFGYYISTDPFSSTTQRYFDVDDGDMFAGAFEMPTGKDANLTIYIWAGIDVFAYNGGIADFSHTAQFVWELPSGVTYSSASGVFMVDRPQQPPPSDPTTVPEPGSVALAGLALALLSRLRRQG